MKVGRENDMGQTEVLDLQERLAETRHNELLGWGAVLISALLVLTLSLISPVAAMLGCGSHVPETAMTFGLSGTGIDLASGLLLLSAALVILGVGLALYCRFVRSKLLAELRASVETTAVLYRADGEEAPDA
jgi:hypothetical protein